MQCNVTDAEIVGEKLQIVDPVAFCLGYARQQTFLFFFSVSLDEVWGAVDDAQQGRIQLRFLKI